MQGRPLTGSRINIWEFDAHIRDNRHEYDAFVYGFAQTISLTSPEIIMTIGASLEMKLLFYLRTAEIANALVLREMFMALVSYMRAEMPMKMDTQIVLSIRQEIKSEILMAIQLRFSLILKKNFKAPPIGMCFTIGSIDVGRTIADVESLTIAQIADMTIEELISGIQQTKYGLRMGLVRMVRIVDIAHLTIADIIGLMGFISDIESLTITQIANMTMEGIAQTQQARTIDSLILTRIF